MTSKHLIVVVSLVTAAMMGSAWSQQDDKLGKVSFPTSCDPKVQADFERGVAMLHSYWFLYARRTFEGVLQQDPNCAMAYWGVAMDLLGNTLAALPPSRANAEVAWAALEKARAIGVKTQRERDWIEALSAYYRDHDKVAVDARLAAYNRAMEQMTQRYPDDYEAQVVYAITLQAAAPKADLTYANQLKSAAILEKLYAQNPQPGVTHFIIHAYDYPSLAHKGIEAARRYGGIAPAVPHARHMPSHIYSMVGLWEESIASNASALEIQPDYYHASDFTVYAHLQLAQDGKAKAMIEKSLATPDRGDRPPTLGAFTAQTAMPARYALERGDWAGAAALPVTSTRFPYADALTRFTRGLGMARSGNLAGAKGEIDAIKALRADLEKANQSYWADRSEEQILAVSAWVALAEGAREQALKFMRAAADGEDGAVKHIAMENRLYPLRELLGELLLEMGQPAAALTEYETALKANPNRYRGFWGAARAADTASDPEKATVYFAKLVDLSKNADTERRESREAKAFLTKK
jgi:tetratricopeptide (TPR) repeat protein